MIEQQIGVGLLPFDLHEDIESQLAGLLLRLVSKAVHRFQL